MTRRTVDITVDAYDAPMLAELAKRRDHQRALGHADGVSHAAENFTAWVIATPHEAMSARRIKAHREHEACVTGRPNALTILMGEVAEVLEAETDAERIYELLDVAAVCMRIASKMQRDIDAREGSA